MKWFAGKLWQIDYHQLETNNPAEDDGEESEENKIRKSERNKSKKTKENSSSHKAKERKLLLYISHFTPLTLIPSSCPLIVPSMWWGLYDIAFFSPSIPIIIIIIPTQGNKSVKNRPPCFSSPLRKDTTAPPVQGTMGKAIMRWKRNFFFARTQRTHTLPKQARPTRRETRERRQRQSKEWGAEVKR